MLSYLKGHWQLLLLTALLFALWQTPAALPFKILVVFLHELSHALAAIATGGTVIELSLSPQQGGHAITRGGNPFVILSAGYLGSLLLGASLLLLALRSGADRLALALCGAVILGVSAFYMRGVFALSFGLGTGAVMLAVARYLPAALSDLLLRLIGLSSVIYVPYDIFDDTLARRGIGSDADMLAQTYGGPTLLWGGLWLLFSLAVIAACLRYGIGRHSNITLRAGA
ncbi:MAG: M50 family metallopeptidase [Sulfitobacter sp.]